MSDIYEKIKTFWDASPCGSKRSDKTPMTKEYFDEIETNRYFVEPHVPGFADFAKWKGKRVLEIGCGIGTDSINFARAGAKITIVDFSPKSLEICKKRFELYQLDATFYLGNSEELRSFVPAQEFDLIYSFGVIHHTAQPKKVIEQLVSYCHKDTELRIMLYSKISWKLFWLMLEYRQEKIADTDKLIQTFSEAQTGCPVTFTYTFDEVKELLMPFFSIDRIWKDHIFIYDIPSYVKREYKIDKYWAGVSPDVLKKWSSELGWHTLVVARPFIN